MFALQLNSSSGFKRQSSEFATQITGSDRSTRPIHAHVIRPLSSEKLASSRKFTLLSAMGPLRTQLPEGASELTLRFLNGNGEWLSGTLVTTGSLEVVLLCHGYMANQSMCRFPALASELAAAGLSSFRFDHPCAWQGASERNGPFLMGNHAAEVADIKCAAQFLRSKGRTVSVLLGHSKGGANVVMYAALHADIPKVVNLAGRYRVREGTLQRVSRGGHYATSGR